MTPAAVSGTAGYAYGSGVTGFQQRRGQRAVSEPVAGGAELKLEVDRQGLTDIVYYRTDP